MLPQPLPDADILRQLLDYNSDSGLLFWKPRDVSWFVSSPRRGGAKNVAAVWNSRYAGTEALGRVTARGYKYGKILQRGVMSHRAIWKIVTGNDPEFIDHINGNRQDNRICNLRSVTFSDNMKNRKIGSSNSSGIMNIFWKSSTRRWKVQVRGGDDGNYQAEFASLDDAINARAQACQRFGYHPNHGRHQ